MHLDRESVWTQDCNTTNTGIKYKLMQLTVLINILNYRLKRNILILKYSVKNQTRLFEHHWWFKIKAY